MSVTTDTHPLGDAGIRAARPAAAASARLSRATAALGALALASSGFVLVRMLESWRVSADAASGRISALGLHIGYPTANSAAVVVLVLAAAGAIVLGITVVGAVRELAADARLRRLLATAEPLHVHDALVIDDRVPRAFCAGLLRPRVYVTTAALHILDEAPLDAVLQHELHHARRRDPLRLAANRVFAGAMFFLPGLPVVYRRQHTLAELSADENAIAAAPANRSALAQAMLVFSDASEPGDDIGIDPARVDYMLGELPGWRFMALLCVALASLLGLVVAVALLAGREAAGSATLAPPFLSAQPCVTVLALIPAAIGLVAVRRTRSRRGQNAARG